jgi:crossover junction endodeoxyribonuclease RusA
MQRVVHKYDIRLPLPPTMNSYWKTTRNGIIYVSNKGKTYRKSVISLVSTARPFRDKLLVHIVYFRPDNRKRDLDNLLKPLLDACTHAALWADDSQIRDLRIVDSGEMVPGGAIHLHVESLLSPPKNHAHHRQTIAERIQDSRRQMERLPSVRSMSEPSEGRAIPRRPTVRSPIRR